MTSVSRFARALVVSLLLLLLVVLSGAAVFYEQPLWIADQILRFRLWEHGVKSHYAEVGGYRIHYLEALPRGGGAGTPLLLIHGLGARAEDWGPLIPGLAAAGFHVYAPDLLGYGRSPRPDVDYSIGLQENLVVQFLQTMHVPRADVGGWSMGGWVAARLALDHPDLIHRLVLYDSAGIYFPARFDATLFIPADEASSISPKCWNPTRGICRPSSPVPRLESCNTMAGSFAAPSTRWSTGATCWTSASPISIAPR
jgi:pimeloyl-ACP methyl ester carboxylesterase